MTADLTALAIGFAAVLILGGALTIIGLLTWGNRDDDTGPGDT